MKLVLAVVEEKIAAGLIERLLEKEFRVTRMESLGGFLRRGNTTILSGVEDDEAQVVVQTIKDYTEKKKLEMIQALDGRSVNKKGGLAKVFVLPVEKMINF